MNQVSEVRRERFIQHVSDLLQVPEHKSLLLRMIDVVPEAFWSAPASSSGQYHPPFALGEGGLVRHTIAVIEIARDLARPYDQTSPVQRDAIVLGAALHDSFKGGPENEWSHTDPAHADIAADYLLRLVTVADDQKFSMLRKVSGIVRTHMTMWGTPPISVEHLSAAAAAVATADYIAARKYLVPAADLAELMEVFV